jgi:hypothetical protein
MSSTSNFETSVTSWDSNNSIDNKATGDPNTCGCCAGTSDSEPPWLQIDLGSVYTIRKIQITGRSDNSKLIFCYLKCFTIMPARCYCVRVID